MIEQKVIDLLTKLEGAIKAYAPTAFKMAVEYYHVRALFYMGLGILGVLTLIIGWKKVFWAVKEGESVGYLDHETTVIVTGVIGGVFAAIGLITAVVTLGDVDTWIGVFRPDLALLADLLRTAMKAVGH